MKLLYISRLNLLSPKAHVYNTLRTVEALAVEPDTQVTLVTVFKKIEPAQLSTLVFEPNSVVPKFTLVQLAAWGYYLGLSRWLLVRLVGTLLDSIRLSAYLLYHYREYDVVYARDHQLWLVWAFARFVLRKPGFFESHFVLSKNFSQRCTEFCIRSATGVITIARALERHYVAMQKNITTIVCAAAEPERFAAYRTKTKTELRTILGLPVSKKIIGYSGNLYQTGNGDSYGIEDVLRALALLPADYIFVGIGKRDDLHAPLEKTILDLGLSDRVVLVPWVSKNEVAPYLLACDALIIPAAGAKPGNSPTKVFEYLISERPIVAANTEPIAEVLVDHQTALLVEYKDPQAWKRALEQVITDAALSETLIRNATLAGVQYSWSNRARKIRSFIETNYHA